MKRKIASLYKYAPIKKRKKDFRYKSVCNKHVTDREILKYPHQNLQFSNFNVTRNNH